jgi:ribose transport system substrate-binding protein
MYSLIRHRLQQACPVLLVVAGVALIGCGGPGTDSSQPNGQANGQGAAPANDMHLAYVTNGVASFWNVAATGVKAGEKEFGVRCDVLMPQDNADQKRMVEDLLARGIDAIAISPIDADNQTPLLNEAARNTILITQDCDAPKSERLCYIGMDNYTAGRMAGQLIKEVLPEGGNVIIFVGRLEQVNAKLRRQGVIDEIMDRSMDRTRFDPPSEVIQGDKYTILDTRTDQLDPGKAKAQAEDAIARYPKLDCMIGLFAYNAPQCLAAVEAADKQDSIKIVGFDEEMACLHAIEQGKIYGTVVQNPFEYGRQSVQIMRALVEGDKSVIPEGGFIDIPAKHIRQDNVREFRLDLEAKIKAAQAK